MNTPRAKQAWCDVQKMLSEPTAGQIEVKGLPAKDSSNPHCTRPFRRRVRRLERSQRHFYFYVLPFYVHDDFPQRKSVSDPRESHVETRSDAALYIISSFFGVVYAAVLICFMVLILLLFCFFGTGRYELIK